MLHAQWGCLHPPARTMWRWRLWWGHYLIFRSPVFRWLSHGIWVDSSQTWWVMTMEWEVTTGGTCHCKGLGVCLRTGAWVVLSVSGTSRTPQRKIFLRPKDQSCAQPISSRFEKFGEWDYNPEWAARPALWIPHAQSHREQHHHLRQTQKTSLALRLPLSTWFCAFLCLLLRL